MKSSKLVLGVAAALFLIAGLVWFVVTPGESDEEVDAATESGLHGDDGQSTQLDGGEDPSSDQGQGPGSVGPADDSAPDSFGEGTEGDPDAQEPVENVTPVEIDSQLNAELLSFEIPAEGDEVQRLDKTFDMIQRVVLYLKESRILIPQPTADKLVRLAMDAYAIDKSDYAPSLIANLLPDYEKEVRAALSDNSSNATSAQFSKAFENINKAE